jgi:hypothetical protein
VRSFSVVPEEPVDEFGVERVYVVTEERKVMLYEAFRQGAIESFNGAIHLGAPWVRVVVADVELGTRIVEQVCKLTAIVGLYFCNGEWGNFNELLEEVGCSF